MTRYIRFDWAIKKLLRQKANYVVLEGLLSTLLEKDIKIDRILESESNQESAEDKQNRVDILTQDIDGKKYIIEVQNANETAYFQRMLFGTSKVITEYINKGDNYEHVAKVYSVNIVYFDLGQGSDYIYHGRTDFKGIHNGEPLKLTPFQMEKFDGEVPGDLYPEYYVLKVNGFNDIARTPLEEWIEFLKTERIPEHPTAPGLREAKEIMRYEHMDAAEKRVYDRHIDNIVILRDNIETAQREGMEKGLAEGLAEGLERGMAEGLERGMAEGRERGMAEGLERGMAEGRAEGRAEGEQTRAQQIAQRLKEMGMSAAEIAAATGIAL